MAARIAAKVKERVAAAMESEEVQKTIEARLIEERAKLEEKVRNLLPTNLSTNCLCMSGDPGGEVLGLHCMIQIAQERSVACMHWGLEGVINISA